MTPQPSVPNHSTEHASHQRRTEGTRASTAEGGYAPRNVRGPFPPTPFPASETAVSQADGTP